MVQRKGGSLSRGDTSRMNREVQVRICEGLGVQFPGPTRHSPGLLGLTAHPGCPLSPRVLEGNRTLSGHWKSGANNPKATLA